MNNTNTNSPTIAVSNSPTQKSPSSPNRCSMAKRFDLPTSCENKNKHKGACEKHRTTLRDFTARHRLLIVDRVVPFKMPTALWLSSTNVDFPFKEVKGILDLHVYPIWPRATDGKKVLLLVSKDDEQKVSGKLSVETDKRDVIITIGQYSATWEWKVSVTSPETPPKTPLKASSEATPIPLVLPPNFTPPRSGDSSSTSHAKATPIAGLTVALDPPVSDKARDLPASPVAVDGLTSQLAKLQTDFNTEVQTVVKNYNTKVETVIREFQKQKVKDATRARHHNFETISV